MNNLWRLPTSITVENKEYQIRTDYRDVLNLYDALGDPYLQTTSELERQYIYRRLFLGILVPNWQEIPGNQRMEAVNELTRWLDMYQERTESQPKPRIMDWSHDAMLIIPEINKILGHDVRSEAYMHWWTFLGYYMSIGESTFSHVVNIRKKRMDGQKLEDWEVRWMSDNMDLVDLPKRLSDEEKRQRDEEENALAELLGG